MSDQAVRPAAAGTFDLPTLDARYTIGREHVGPVAMYLARNTRSLAVDIETEGTGRAAMRCKAVTLASTRHAVVLDPRDPAQAEMVRAALGQADELVLHNSPFDVPVLVRLGLMALDDVRKVRDTLTYCRLAEPDERTQKSLLAASARYLGSDGTDILTQAFKALGLSKTNGFKAFDLDRPVYVQGAAIDGIVTARLLPLARQAAYDRLTSGHPFTTYGVSGAEAERLVEREQIINRVFLRRAARGLRVDLERLDKYRAEVATQQGLDRLVLEEVGIREGRGTDLTTWLDGQGLLPDDYPRTPKTNAASGQADHLKLLAHPVAEAFVRLKETAKIEKDYLVKVVDLADEQDRVHPTTSILGAATGRMSMGEPPLQQFPDGARGIILADEGDAMTSIDWSQIEPVVAANIARDTAVLAGYEAGTSDLYTDIAGYAGISRKQAKVVLLAQMYGEGMAKLAADLRITIDAAWELRRQVFRAMPQVDKLIRRLRTLGEQHQLIFTLSGRIVPIPSGQYGVAVHKAVNYFVQGGAYDVLAEAIVAIDAAGLGDGIYLAMHDELVVSTSIAAEVEEIMRTPPDRLCRMAGRTPVLRTDRADLGERWAAA